MKREQYNKKNLVGQKFGNLTVIEELPKRTKQGYVIWKCKCVCGNVVEVPSYKLTSGKTWSCGCMKKKRKHGFATHKNRHPLYKIWEGMKTRCYNPKHHTYKYYGARGIEMCDKWKNDFMSFYTWAVNNGWRKGLTIDRINNDGNYCPENCRWVTYKQNNLNTRRSIGYYKAYQILYYYLNNNVSQRKTAEKFGVDLETVHRIVNGEIYVGGYE